MAAQSSKIKTLYVMKLLLERTDENHILSASDIIEILEEEYGIKAERKGIYSDVDTLIEYGLDIIKNKGTNSGYYLASREFELPEIKLLVDAVQSSKFITKKKSDELIKKIEKLTSDFEAKNLNRQVYIYNRIKTDNESIYYSVDLIHDAIYANKNITFQYMDWTPDKKMIARHDGQTYEISPWALSWDDENYYLVAYDDEAGKIKHYRVDKIKNITISKNNRSGQQAFKDFDLAAYSNKTFGMFSGYDEKVTLLCDNRLAGVIIDRFGKDFMSIPYDDSHFKAVLDVTVSSHFFGWLISIGSGVKILEPLSVREEFIGHMKNLMEDYLFM